MKYTDSLNDFREKLAQIGQSADMRFGAGLIDLLRYQHRLTTEIGAALNQLTGQDLDPAWDVWVEWAGKDADSQQAENQHTKIESFVGYVGWRRVC